jgi:hypothetical protein
VVRRRQEWLMGNRTLLPLAAALALAIPSVALAGGNWSLTLGVWGGVSRYDVLGLGHGVGAVGSEDGRDLLEGNFNAVGASAVLRLGWLDLGALYEGTLLDRHARSEVLTPLVGFAWNVTDKVRLDVLGELGGHRINDIGRGNDLLAEPPKTVWLPYVGVRPTLSYRLPVGPTRLVFSATPFARWDLVKKEVVIQTSSGPASHTVYEAGGTAFGLVGGIGIEI